MNNQELVDQLQKLNQQYMDNLMNQFQQKNNSRKLQKKFKKSQTEFNDYLKKQLLTADNTTNNPNTSLSDLFSKLLNKK